MSYTIEGSINSKELFEMFWKCESLVRNYSFKIRKKSMPEILNYVKWTTVKQNKKNV